MFLLCARDRDSDEHVISSHLVLTIHFKDLYYSYFTAREARFREVKELSHVKRIGINCLKNSLDYVIKLNISD